MEFIHLNYEPTGWLLEGTEASPNKMDSLSSNLNTLSSKSERLSSNLDALSSNPDTNRMALLRELPGDLAVRIGELGNRKQPKLRLQLLGSPRITLVTVPALPPPAAGIAAFRSVHR